MAGQALLGAPEEREHTASKTAAHRSCLLMEDGLPTMADSKSTAAEADGGRLTFGKSATFQVGTQRAKVTLTRMDNRCELYRLDRNAGDFHFEGVVTHLARMSDRHSSVDATKATSTAVTGAVLAAPAKAAVAKTKDGKAKGPKSFLDKERAKLAKTRQRNPFQPAAASSAASTPRLASHLAPPSPSPALVTRRPAFSSLPRTPVIERRLKVLRVPFIHLLAVRPATKAYLMQKLCISAGECAELLEKTAREHMVPGQWTLAPRGYKELDVWRFPYRTAASRQLAVEQAILAYDRLRLSTHDELWQRLLPAAERGQGRILSRLNLHYGATVFVPPAAAPAPMTGVKKAATKKSEARKAKAPPPPPPVTAKTTKATKATKAIKPAPSPDPSPRATPGKKATATVAPVAPSRPNKRKADEGADEEWAAVAQAAEAAAAKRPRWSSLSTTPALTADRSASPLSPDPAELRTVLRAIEFKELHASYVALHAQVAAHVAAGTASPRQLAEVTRLHERLVGMKAAIVRMAASLAAGAPVAASVAVARAGALPPTKSGA
ncbi:MAG: hypothetical protein M1826_007697 [Phylliscum demangeonii]|nr:MAG: hypothetical protein M1826_007697 [Phylliscum demangeonii]